MRIFEENEISYSIEDVIDAINDELGFSFVKSGDTQGYFVLGSKIRLNVDFNKNGEVFMELNFPSNKVDLSQSIEEVEAYAAACESVQQIRQKIEEMSKDTDKEI